MVEECIFIVHSVEQLMPGSLGLDNPIDILKSAFKRLGTGFHWKRICKWWKVAKLNLLNGNWYKKEKLNNTLIEIFNDVEKQRKKAPGSRERTGPNKEHLRRTSFKRSRTWTKSWFGQRRISHRQKKVK